MSRYALHLTLLLVVIGICTPVTSAKKPNPNTYTGTFAVHIRGYWTGQGTATVTQSTVQIQATVADDSGNVGTLTTDTLNVVEGHFSGTGTVFGLAMTISGRVEAEDPPPANPGKGKGKSKSSANDEQVLTDARLGATFTAGGHGGRIAGGRDQ